MNDKKKKEILRLLLQNPKLKNSTAPKLKICLSKCSPKISLKTIEKYKYMIDKAKNKYDNSVVFDNHCNDEKIIEDIIKELSRNRDRIKEREYYRNKIRNELSKYKNDKKAELLKNENNISGQNKIKKEIKKEICSKLTDIDPKTLNYLYNDEAKKSDLLPKRVTVTSDLIKEIEDLFNNGVIEKYISDNHDSNKSVVQMIQDYIEINYKTKLSHSIIQRYFHTYFKKLFLKKMYEDC